MTGIQNDSNAIEKGNIYVAETNGVHNGHFYIDSAIEKGASLVIARLMIEGADSAMMVSEENDDEAMARYFKVRSRSRARRERQVFVAPSQLSKAREQPNGG